MIRRKKVSLLSHKRTYITAINNLSLPYTVPRIYRKIFRQRKQAISGMLPNKVHLDHSCIMIVLVSLDTEVRQGIVQSKLDCTLFVRAPD